MKNPYRALEAIERLVGSDFGFEMEWFASAGGNDGMDSNYSVPALRKTLKQAARMITDIYLIAHSETEHACRHEGWEQRKYDILSEPGY